MCSTEPGLTLVMVLVAAAVLGALPLGLAWRALRRGTRGARLAPAVAALALAALTVALRPSDNAPRYAGVRQVLLDAVSYGLTWVFLAIGLAWLVAAWRAHRGLDRAALVLSLVPLLVVAAWGGYTVLGPDACAELMAPRT